MKEEKKINSSSMTRRGFFSTGLMLPFLSITAPLGSKPIENQDEEFTTLLTSKGTVVRVRKKAIKKAKILKKKVSNKSLLSWLNLK